MLLLYLHEKLFCFTIKATQLKIYITHLYKKELIVSNVIKISNCLKILSSTSHHNSYVQEFFFFYKISNQYSFISFAKNVNSRLCFLYINKYLFIGPFSYWFVTFVLSVILVNAVQALHGSKCFDSSKFKNVPSIRRANRHQQN